MKRVALIMMFCCLAVAFLPINGRAEIEWQFMENLALEDSPLDIALSKDGATGYVLCQKSIFVVSIGKQNEIIKKIPLETSYKSITLASNQETLLLSSTDQKKVAFLNVYSVFDLPIESSPIIGNPKAPVNITAFLDFQ